MSEAKRFVKIVGEDGQVLPEQAPLPKEAGEQIGWIVVDRFTMRVLDAQLWDVKGIADVVKKASERGSSDMKIARDLLSVGEDAREAVHKAVLDALAKFDPEKTS